MLQNHFSFKFFIELKVLVTVNGLSQIILNYLSFTVKEKKAQVSKFHIETRYSINLGTASINGFQSLSFSTQRLASRVSRAVQVTPKLPSLLSSEQSVQHCNYSFGREAKLLPSWALPSQLGATKRTEE